VTFGEQLLQLRLVRSLSQEELAAVSGVSARTISNLERTATLPRPATVRALARGLGLDDSQCAALDRAARASTDSRERYVSGGHSLPAAVTSIVGRSEEIALISRRMLRGRRRLVTLTGPGGVGKSRLALEVGWRIADRFDRADAVDLSALRDREDVLVAIGTAVGLAVDAPATVASVAAQVGDVAWLLLVDSLEHVADVASDLDRLLALCPRLRILATTRARTQGDVTVLPLAGDHAVRLLVERVRAVRPGFGLTAANADAVVTVCERLDGLPLAIELAAGHLRTRDVDEFVRDLDATALHGDLVDLPTRHRTLRDLVTWSTDRLSDVDRHRFVVLGAFRGPAPVAAVEAVLRDIGTDADASATFERLASVNLVTVTARGLVVLDTIREVAEDLLDGSGLGLRCRRAHARYMLQLLRDADPEQVESHMDNVRAAVAFASDHAPAMLDSDVVKALADHLGDRARFGQAHRMLGDIAGATRHAEARRVALLRAGVAANLNGDPRAALGLASAAKRAADENQDVDAGIAALNLIGAAHKGMGNLDAACRAYEECLAAATGLNRMGYVTVVLNNLGTVAHERGDYQRALDHYRRSLAIKRSADEPRGVATALVNVGGLLKDLGESAEARDDLLEAHRLFVDLADPYRIAFTLALLAEAQLSLGDPGAGESAAQAVRLAIQIDHGQTRAMAELALGDVAASRGDTDAASAAYQRALTLGPEPYERARVLERQASIRAASDPDGAARLLDQADEIRTSGQYAIPPIDRPLAEATRRRLSTAVNRVLGTHDDSDSTTVDARPRR
jgi:predicted ATPase/DNA-binding XRE family transcriptional regulator